MKKSILALLPFLFYELNFSMDYSNTGNSGYKRIDTSIPEQYDGPYVQYSAEQVFAKYVVPNNDSTNIIKTDSVALVQKDKLLLKVMTDIADKTFLVQLKKELQNENSEFPKVGKLLALSDN